MHKTSALEISVIGQCSGLNLHECPILNVMSVTERILEGESYFGYINNLYGDGFIMCQH